MVNTASDLLLSYAEVVQARPSAYLYLRVDLRFLMRGAAVLASPLRPELQNPQPFSWVWAVSAEVRNIVLNILSVSLDIHACVFKQL